MESISKSMSCSQQLKYLLQNASAWYDESKKTLGDTRRKLVDLYRMGYIVDLDDYLITESNIQLLVRLVEEYSIVCGNPRNESTTIAHSLRMINSLQAFDLARRYIILLELFDNANNLVGNTVKRHPLWELFFRQIKGCPYIVAAKLLGFLDINKASTVSGFWVYCGVTTVKVDNGTVLPMSKQLINVEDERRNKIGYSPELQSAVVYDFVNGILENGQGGIYHEHYNKWYNYYKVRENISRPNPKHLHQMAARQCAKELLRDLWVTWKKYEQS